MVRHTLIGIVLSGREYSTNKKSKVIETFCICFLSKKLIHRQKREVYLLFSDSFFGLLRNESENNLSDVFHLLLSLNLASSPFNLISNLFFIRKHFFFQNHEMLIIGPYFVAVAVGYLPSVLRERPIQGKQTGFNIVASETSVQYR
jgi:hypothetical protein